MRIAVVVHAFPKLSETFIVNKVVGLSDRNFDVSIVCKSSSKREWSRFAQLQSRKALRERILINPPVHPRFLVLLLFPILLVRSLILRPNLTLRYLRKGFRRLGFGVFRSFYLDSSLILAQPDVIHFEFGALAVGKMYLRDLLNCRIVVSFRGYDINFAGLNAPSYYEDVWKDADCLHFLGENLWQQAQKRGCPPTKAHMLVPPAVDIEFFSPTCRKHEEIIGTPERPARLLSVGRLDWKKGYEFSLLAARLLVDRGLHLEWRIVGGGVHSDALHFWRSDLHLQDCVSFLGEIPPSGVKAQLEWADIFVHAAISEGFCNAVIEAQAMGLPVVTSDADGLVENVENGVTGFIVPRYNPAAIADKILLLARDAKRRQQFGAAGTARVLQHFSLNSQIEAFSNLYQQLASSSRE